METRANYVVVGVFTLLAILAALGFVYWKAGSGSLGELVILNVRIPGSAAGLGRGSSVLFNGVKVGDVSRVYIDINNPDVAIAETRVDRLTPVTPSTQAEIGVQGLTGQAYIEMIGGNPKERNILDKAAEEGVDAIIEAKPSAVTNILKTAQDIANRTNEVLASVQSFFDESREPLKKTLENAETFSDALAKNADGIDTFLSSVGELSETLKQVSGKLESTLTAAEDVLKAVDGEKVGQIVDNAAAFSERLDKASEGLEDIVASVDEAVKSFGAVADKAQGTLTEVDRIVAGVDPGRVSSAIANFEQASRDTRVIAQDIAKVTEKVGRRADDIDQVITDASEIARRLKDASARVDGVLAKVDGFLGDADGEDLFAQAAETLKSIREIADTLNARMGTITDGLARFSGQGLRDVEALVRDSRRSISRIERAVSDLERNPQRIITGGEGDVRRSDGRSRR